MPARRADDGARSPSGRSCLFRPVFSPAPPCRFATSPDDPGHTIGTSWADATSICNPPLRGVPSDQSGSRKAVYPDCRHQSQTTFRDQPRDLALRRDFRRRKIRSEREGRGTRRLSGDSGIRRRATKTNRPSYIYHVRAAGRGLAALLSRMGNRHRNGAVSSRRRGASAPLGRRTTRRQRRGCIALGPARIELDFMGTSALRGAAVGPQRWSDQSISSHNAA